MTLLLEGPTDVVLRDLDSPDARIREIRGRVAHTPASQQRKKLLELLAANILTKEYDCTKQTERLACEQAHCVWSDDRVTP